jgi:hypothetical protein
MINNKKNKAAQNWRRSFPGEEKNNKADYKE